MPRESSVRLGTSGTTRQLRSSAYETAVDVVDDDAKNGQANGRDRHAAQAPLSLDTQPQYSPPRRRHSSAPTALSLGAVRGRGERQPRAHGRPEHAGAVERTIALNSSGSAQ